MPLELVRNKCEHLDSAEHAVKFRQFMTWPFRQYSLIYKRCKVGEKFKVYNSDRQPNI